jgi:SAM-dependent methyltransferase
MNADPYQELTQYQRSAVLMAAAKLGVFAAFGGSAATAAEVADRLRAPQATIARLLAALAALQYLAREGERFALNDFSKTFVRGGAGGMARLAWKEHLFYVAWGRLNESICSGKALFPSFAERVAKDFESVEKFLLALNDLAEMAAPGVIATGVFDGAKTILDLGGGGGGYAAALTQALPGARVTLGDLREIVPVAKEYLERKRLGKRVEIVEADFGKEDCGLANRKFDRVLLSHVLHDFDATSAARIVERAGRLVGPDGKLVILDVLVPEGGQSDPVEALFDLMMLVEVPGGSTHRIEEVSEWIAAAGMRAPKKHKLYFGMLLEAWRLDSTL